MLDQFKFYRESAVNSGKKPKKLVSVVGDRIADIKFNLVV